MRDIATFFPMDSGEVRMLEEFESQLWRRRLSPHTIRLRLSYARRMLAALDPQTATRAEIERWIDAHDWSAESVNTAVTSIRSFFAWQKDAGHREDDPGDSIPYVQVTHHRARIAQEEQITAALEVADPQTAAIILLGAACGLRRHEIAKVHVRDIDGEFLTVLGKGGRVRVVHMPPELRQLIPFLGDGYWFPGGDNGHLSGTTIYRRIREHVHVNPHALRHRAGTVVYRGTGNNLRVTQEFLGHASPQTTALYVHVTRDDMRQASAAARIDYERIAA